MKNFILGLGIGIVVVTLWFFLANSFSGNAGEPEVVVEELTDEEIIELAKDLGMVNANDLPTVNDVQVELTDNDIVEKAREFGMLFPEEAVIEQGDENISSTSNESLTDGEEVDNLETDATDVETAPKEYVELRVFAGMTARNVAKLLYDKKVVENSRDFENYIVSKSATTKIRSGYYKLAKGSDFDEILYLLTTAPNKRKN